MKDILDEIIIDKRSTVPEYIQLSEQIKHIITMHKEDERLIDMKLLQEKFELDANIIKQALDRLVGHDYLDYRKYEYKYYYKYLELAMIKNQKFSSLLNVILKMNQKPTLKISNTEHHTIDEKLAQRTSFPIGTKVVCDHRIYYGNDVPKAFAYVFYTQEIYELHKDKLNKEHPEYLVLTKKDVEELPFNRHVKAVQFPKEINILLTQEPKSGGFLSVEHYYDQDNNLRIYVETYLNLNFGITL